MFLVVFLKFSGEGHNIYFRPTVFFEQETIINDTKIMSLLSKKYSQMENQKKTSHDLELQSQIQGRS